jgi:hypothetical protein
MPPLAAIMPYMGNTPLHTELKLTAEQIQKVNAFQNTWIGDYINLFGDTSAEGNKAREEQVKKAEKFLTETLNPDQLKRLNQIALQRLADTAERFGSSRILSQSVLDDLKLTDDQKKKLTDNAKLADVLTNAQKAKWKEMLGEPFAVQLRPTFGPSTPGGGGFAGFNRTPTEVQYLQLAVVEQELKLTDKQKEKVTSLASSRGTITDQALGEFLDKGQIQRLRQIMLQNQLKTQGFATVLSSTAVEQQLGLSQDQVTKSDAVLKKHADEFRKLVLSGDEYEKILPKVEVSRTTRDKDLLAVLDEKQQGKWKEMQGEAFAGQLPRFSTFGGFTTPGGGARPGGGGQPATPRGTTSSLYNSLLSYLTEKGIQEDLKLSAEQLKKINDYIEKYRTNPDATAERIKVIREIMTPEQFKRYEQVLFQLYERRGLASALRLQEIAQQLKLTDEQKTKLANNEEPAKVLTADQTAKLKELRGEPFKGELSAAAAAGRPSLPGTSAGGTPRPGGTTRPPAAPVHLRYLQDEGVRKDLQLTEDQVKGVQTVEDKRQTLFKDYGTLPRAEQTAKRTEVNAAVEKQIAELLKPEQAKRLKQLELQQQTSTPFGATFLLAPDIAQALKLTQEQQDKMKAIQANATKVENLIQSERLVSLGTDRTTPTLTTEFRKVTQDKLTNLFTTEQKAAWKDLLGKPFEGRLPALGTFGERGR